MLVPQTLNVKCRWACAGHVEIRRRRCEIRLEYQQEVQARQHLEILSRYHTSNVLGSHEGAPDMMIEKSWNLLLDAMICKTHAECFNAAKVRAQVSREWKQAVSNFNYYPDGWTEACKVMLLPDPRQAVYDLLSRHRQELREAASKAGASGETSEAEGGRDKKRPRLG